jgi:hypothetical protein
MCDDGLATQMNNIVDELPRLLEQYEIVNRMIGEIGQMSRLLEEYDEQLDPIRDYTGQGSYHLACNAVYGLLNDLRGSQVRIRAQIKALCGIRDADNLPSASSDEIPF